MSTSVSKPNQQLQVLMKDLVEGSIFADHATAMVPGVRDDSRMVQQGDMFVAVPGTAADGGRFIGDALDRGAAYVVHEMGGTDVSDDVVRITKQRGGVLLPVKNARWALGEIARRFHDAADRLSLTAITGTNGKTTTTYLCESILAAGGRSPGIIGTVEYRYAGQRQPAPLTTPGALMLHGMFAKMHEAGCTDVVLEASSHALVQDRLSACRFRVAALTNVTQDHLDYHETMAAYFAAKSILFSSLLGDDGVAVMHGDREDGQRMMASTRDGLRVLTVPSRVGGSEKLDFVIESAALDGEGTRATVVGPAGRMQIESALVGDYNLANVMLAVGVGVAHGLSVSQIESGVAAVKGVPGRLQAIPNMAGVLCVVDYAHTPDALERALAALRPLCTGRLITVFGCGGDRDNTKRAPMGRAAAQGADVAIVTSDNPRTEDPARIIAMVVQGVSTGDLRECSARDLQDGEVGFHVQPDRRTAIALAIAIARAGDVVLLAGKGHEDYQILGKEKIHFDDREEAERAFAEREQGGAST